MEASGDIELALVGHSTYGPAVSVSAPAIAMHTASILAWRLWAAGKKIGPLHVWRTAWDSWHVRTRWAAARTCRAYVTEQH